MASVKERTIAEIKAMEEFDIQVAKRAVDIVDFIDSQALTINDGDSKRLSAHKRATVRKLERVKRYVRNTLIGDTTVVE
jgi:hypothetical protein